MFFNCRVPVAEDLMRACDGFPEVNVIVSSNKVPLEDEVRNPPMKISIDKYLMVTSKEPPPIVKM